MREVVLHTTPICPTTYNEWEHPNNISTRLDYYYYDEDQVQGDNINEEGQGEECSKSITSSIYQIKELISINKLKHNAGERDRRNKINCLYAVLRACLPSTLYPKSKKLSNATTVEQVLKYIPQIEDEVEDLMSLKQELSSQQSKLNGQTKKRNKYKDEQKEKPQHYSSSVFVDELNKREVIIRISTNEKRSLPHEVILLLENKGFLIIHVSSFQLFGERTFYNIHICMEESISMEFKRLDEEIVSLFENHRHENFQ